MRSNEVDRRRGIAGRIEQRHLELLNVRCMAGEQTQRRREGGGGRGRLEGVVTGCVGLLVFHRGILLSGFDIVQANVGDLRSQHRRSDFLEQALSEAITPLTVVYRRTRRDFGHRSTMCGSAILRLARISTVNVNPSLECRM